jgi:hypothetical protein
MTIHRVIFEEGNQTILTVPQDNQKRGTRVSSAVYSIDDWRQDETNDDRVVVAETAATIDSVNTTTTATAGNTQANPDQVVLTSATGIVEGHQYLVSDSGDRELVRVRAIDGTTIKLHAHLSREYASGAAFQGVEVSGTFPSAEAADEDRFDNGGGPYKIRWEWTIDGIKHVVDESCQVVRNTNEAGCQREDVENLAPSLAVYLTGEDSILKYITIASRRFNAELRAARVNPRRFHTDDLTRLACAHLAVWYAMIDRGDEHIERAELYRGEYEKLRNSMILGTHPADTVNPDEVTDTAPAGGSVGLNSIWDLS